MARIKGTSGTDPFSGRKDPLEQAIIKGRTKATPVTPPPGGGGGGGGFSAFTNEQGRLSGFTIDGKDFFGASPKQVRAAHAKFLRGRGLGPEPLQFRSDIAAGERQLRERQALAGQIGQLGDTGATTPTELSREQALKAGLAGVAPSALKFGAVALAGSLAVTAATAGGAAPAIPAAVAIGAGAGAIVGFYTDYRRNIKSQATGIVRGQVVSIPDTEKSIRELINMQNSQIGNPETNIELMNEGLALIERSHSQLQLDTKANLKKFIEEDGTRQLMKFDIFYDTGRDTQFIELMNEATILPDPNRVLIYTGDVGATA